ncbi:MAG: hypothetical protein QXI89_00140 [Candidatus Anstonellales archaeon]
MSNSIETIVIFGFLLSIVMLSIVIGQGNMQVMALKKDKSDLMYANSVLNNAITQLVSCSDNCSINVSFPSYIIINKSSDTCILSNGNNFLNCFIPFNKTFYVNGTVFRMKINNTNFGVDVIE